MNENINNLFNFYREVGTCSSVSLIEKHRFSLVSGQNNSWPQMVFELDLTTNSAQALEQVLTETVRENLPGFAVCKVSLFNKEALEYLRHTGIYPIKMWTLMDAIPHTQPIEQQQKNIEIKKLNTEDELHAFTALVNTGLMQSVKINLALAKQLQMKNTFGFYGLFFEGELVSGLLTYSDTKTTGLYFIVTKPTCQGKGFAAQLIRYVTNFCRQKKDKVVLQAVQKAVPLYSRLDFSSRGKLAIFWKR